MSGWSDVSGFQDIHCPKRDTKYPRGKERTTITDK